MCNFVSTLYIWWKNHIVFFTIWSQELTCYICFVFLYFDNLQSNNRIILDMLHLYWNKAYTKIYQWWNVQAKTLMWDIQLYSRVFCFFNTIQSKPRLRKHCQTSVIPTEFRLYSWKLSHGFFASCNIFSFFHIESGFQKQKLCK